MTAEKHNIKLTGKLEDCESCMLAKAKKKIINKKDNTYSKCPGERLYVDLSPSYKASMGGSKHWLLVVDQCTKFKWSCFLRKKNDLAEELMKIVKKISNDGNKVKFIRCDNGGENLIIKQHLIDNDVKGIDMEFTSPDTPQKKRRG